MMAMDDKNPGSKRFGLDKASLFLTLRKVWSREAPRNLGLILLQTCMNGMGPELCRFESYALAVAHLLPVLIRCVSISSQVH